MLTDALTAVFLLAFVFWGSKRGVMKMLMSALGLVVSILAGVFLYRPASSFLTGLGLADKLEARFTENMDGIAGMPGIMRDLISVTGAENALARSLAGAAVGALSFLAVLAMVRALLAIMGAVMGIAGALPVIRQANGLLGGIMGFFEGTIVLFVIFAVIAVIEAFWRPGLTEALLSGSHIAALIYNNNPLLGLVVGTVDVIR